MASPIPQPGSAEYVVSMLTIRGKLCPHNPKLTSSTQSGVPSCLGFFYHSLPNNAILLLKSSALCKACFGKAVPNGYMVYCKRFDLGTTIQDLSVMDAARWWHFQPLGLEIYGLKEEIKLPLASDSNEHRALQFFLAKRRPFYMTLFHLMGENVPKSLTENDITISTISGEICSNGEHPVSSSVQMEIKLEVRQKVKTPHFAGLRMTEQVNSTTFGIETKHQAGYAFSGSKSSFSQPLSDRSIESFTLSESKQDHLKLKPRSFEKTGPQRYAQLPKTQVESLQPTESQNPTGVVHTPASSSTIRQSSAYSSSPNATIIPPTRPFIPHSVAGLSVRSKSIGKPAVTLAESPSVSYGETSPIALGEFPPSARKTPMPQKTSGESDRSPTAVTIGNSPVESLKLDSMYGGSRGPFIRHQLRREVNQHTGSGSNNTGIRPTPRWMPESDRKLIPPRSKILENQLKNGAAAFTSQRSENQFQNVISSHEQNTGQNKFVHHSSTTGPGNSFVQQAQTNSYQHSMVNNNFALDSRPVNIGQNITQQMQVQNDLGRAKSNSSNLASYRGQQHASAGRVHAKQHPSISNPKKHNTNMRILNTQGNVQNWLQQNQSSMIPTHMNSNRQARVGAPSHTQERRPYEGVHQARPHHRARDNHRGLDSHQGAGSGQFNAHRGFQGHHGAGADQFSNQRGFGSPHGAGQVPSIESHREDSTHAHDERAIVPEPGAHSSVGGGATAGLTGGFAVESFSVMLEEFNDTNLPDDGNDETHFKDDKLQGDEEAGPTHHDTSDIREGEDAMDERLSDADDVLGSHGVEDHKGEEMEGDEQHLVNTDNDSDFQSVLNNLDHSDHSGEEIGNDENQPPSNAGDEFDSQSIYEGSSQGPYAEEREFSVQEDQLHSDAEDAIDSQSIYGQEEELFSGDHEQALGDAEEELDTQSIDKQSEEEPDAEDHQIAGLDDLSGNELEESMFEEDAQSTNDFADQEDETEEQPFSDIASQRDIHDTLEDVQSTYEFSEHEDEVEEQNFSGSASQQEMDDNADEDTQSTNELSDHDDDIEEQTFSDSTSQQDLEDDPLGDTHSMNELSDHDDDIEEQTFSDSTSQQDLEDDPLEDIQSANELSEHEDEIEEQTFSDSASQQDLEDDAFESTNELSEHEEEVEEQDVSERDLQSENEAEDDKSHVDEHSVSEVSEAEEGGNEELSETDIPAVNEEEDEESHVEEQSVGEVSEEEQEDEAQNDASMMNDDFGNDSTGYDDDGWQAKEIENYADEADAGNFDDEGQGEVDGDEW